MMNSFNRCFKLFPAVFALGFCGCSLFPEPRQSAIEYYDLKPPAEISAVPLDVEQFANFSSERQRMISRENEISVRSSDFHKWVQSPGAMLTRFLRLAFRKQLQDPAINRNQTVILSGEVLTFEKRGKTAVLGIRYHLKYKRQVYSKTVTIPVEMKNNSPTAFAEAMSTAAERFARMAAAEARRIAAERK